MKIKMSIAALMAVSLVACSTPRLVVDPSTIKDQAAYERDLNTCEGIADKYDRSSDVAGNTVIAGAAGGTAVAGIATAVAGAIFWPAIPFIIAGTVAAGTAGGGATKISETEAKERILSDCMTSRGYRTYNGSQYSSATVQPPIQTSVSQPTTSQPSTMSVSPTQSKLKLELPVGWEKKALTETMMSSQGVLYSTNPTRDSGLLLSTADPKNITNIQEYAATRRAIQADKLTTAQLSELENLVINGRRAVRFRVSGELKSGTRMTYMMTLIEGHQEVAILNTWATPSNFDLQKSALADLSARVEGL